MHLSIQLLSDVVDVNHYSLADVVTLNEGDSPTLYFQLVDISVNKYGNPRGRRYIPPALSSLEVTLRALNTDETLVLNATQPFDRDPSIWSIALDAEDTVPGTRAMKVALSEPVGEDETVVKNGWVEQAVVVYPMSPEF